MKPQPAAAPFAHLFQPGRIGSLEIRNRLVMCPMADGFSNADGTVSAAQVEYYAARARGGVGLVIVGSCVVAYPRAAFTRTMTGISDTRFLPGLKTLVRGVQEPGARIAAQLVHDGVYAMEDVAAGRPLLVPSPPLANAPDRLALMASPAEMAARMAPFQAATARLAYKEADEADLAEVIAEFANAAGYAQEAGFDGVEIHAGHGYLIDTFISPALNRRTDGWGGSLENRARLLCEVVRAVRARVGAGYPVWCRLNAFERYVENGETLEQAIAVAGLAANAGLDAIHVTANANPALGIAPIASHTPHTPNALLTSAAAMKQALDIPVIAMGRIGAEDAAQAITAGQADFIAMGRKLLADPELPNKLAHGAAEDIRPCIYHYRCIGNLYLRGALSCVVNPELGKERVDTADRATAKSKRVLIVGGGPAGLETARRLALAGAHVILAERGDALGGQLRNAARADDDMKTLLAWLLREVQRLSVDVRLGQQADAAFVDAVAPDAVVIAAGSAWARPNVDGADLPLVCDADHTRWDSAFVRGARVVILGGGKAGLSLAATAVMRGGEVTVLERGALFAPELGPPGRAHWVNDLEKRGVSLCSGAVLQDILPQAVRWMRENGVAQETRADVVVAAETVTARACDVGPFTGTVLRVGECAGARHIEGAMQSAMHAAESLYPRG